MNGTEPFLSTHGLTKQFDRRIAVHEVDLQIASGEVFGLIGPNGAGKTTLIRMLATAVEPTRGEIHLNGERLASGLPNPRLRRWIGYLPDDFPLYEDLTVWDYLDYFARLYGLRGTHRRRRLWAALELVNLESKAKSLTATLSRGMKQRLGLARTIVHEPILLLLDEPVSGLDLMARMQFRQTIKTLQEAGMTILISSHILSDLAELCTSIGMMELGHLVESTPLQDLYNRLGQQQITLATLADLSDLKTELHKHPLVQGIQLLPDARQIEIRFSGGLAEQAELLRSLIAAGIPLTTFHATQTSLETIVLELGHQQVS
jgi:ABC-2 type transport system ATP-binding protein